ncbi:hypothetical protein BDW02DRAFT_165658 [Decorospora gaudefroyi]|uniref:Uncharacterized protein n=1 Tax=Decorospora gaudefroyi TaxID=184978 RepID=A0A6A5JYL8_9PLEO|nr:hypothetical protein BDW02DRAFT_165658 [Decorospora gaudefroyi]
MTSVSAHAITPQTTVADTSMPSLLPLQNPVSSLYTSAAFSHHSKVRVIKIMRDSSLLHRKKPTYPSLVFLERALLRYDDIRAETHARLAMPRLRLVTPYLWVVAETGLRTREWHWQVVRRWFRGLELRARASWRFLKRREAQVHGEGGNGNLVAVTERAGRERIGWVVGSRIGAGQ